jgi:hypothetical protein
MRASNPVAPPCAGAAATTTGSSLAAVAGRATPLEGAVRLGVGPSGWVLQAPLGPAASYVSQSFPRSTWVSVEFCLRAPRGAATTLVRLEPGGISLELRRGQLQLRSARPGRLDGVAHRVTLNGRATMVELAIAGQRVNVYAGGQPQESFVGKSIAPSRVELGSLVRTRRSSITLASLTVTTSTGQVIPAPASAAASAPSGSSTQASAGTTAPSVLAPGWPTTAAPTPVSPTPVSPTPVSPTPGSPAGGSTSTGATGGTGGVGSGISGSAWPGNPFSPTSFWNAPLGSQAPLDPDSQAYVNELVRQVTTYGPWMNTTSYSVPVYVVPGSEPVQHVTLDTWGPDLQQAFDAVPIPAGAKAAAGSDEHMVVWQPSTNTMWEFWQMHQESDGWHAQWGGEMDDVSTDPGYFSHTGQTTNWGATATGLPLLGGLVTEADLQRGYINHALAISLVETARGCWSWPAQRGDGSNSTPGITPIPEGTRFRLDPTLNIASLNLPPIDRMLAQAAQTYGIVVRDQAGSVAFYGQDPVSLPSNPWPAAFGNQYPNQVLALFPWSHLEALQTQQSCSSTS